MIRPVLSCSACGADNPGGAKFCLECGQPLALRCTSCGAAVTATQRFCGECGAPQHEAPGPVPAPAALALVADTAATVSKAERRVCSVLLVDLVGFTPLSEARDAEDVRELLSLYFERARTIIQRYGGVVEKFIGDAVMAIWGTPVAVEGDAERAVRAGLDLVVSVAELGELAGAPGLAARAGVVTGDVAITVGVIGQGVAGDTVNTAARVQSAAAPGSVWVDDVTERITHAAIGYVDVGDHVLKGKAEPRQLWAATRVLSTVGGVQRVDGLEAPMLGRDVELRTVKELFHLTVERRTARLVVISGPAGIGKSRLGWEFEKYIDGLAESVYWHRGRCLSYGDGVAFWALAEAVRQRLGIADEDAPGTAAAKLLTGLETHVPDPAERSYVGVRLARLLGVTVADDDPAAVLQREELFAGWRLFLERLAVTRPVVLLLEDVQHADTGLLDFLDHLADWSRSAALFVLAFARSDLLETHPGWGVGRNRTALTLETLDDTAMDTLVDTLVPGMPPATRAVVAEQAQGIPLFAVETIRSLIDRDVVVPRDGVYRLVGDASDLTVPDTLRGLLAARFDALPAQLHTVLTDAAVLGSNFPAEALEAISGRDAATVRAALDDLVRREILDVSADPLSPQRGFYAFTQNLLRQVVYDTLSRRDRKVRHLAVAAHLRSTFANDGDEVIEVVARHYVDALGALPDDPDAGSIRDLAVAALVRGAARARQAGAPRRAAHGLATAAELLGDTGTARRAELWSQAAEAASVGGQLELSVGFADTAATLYERAGNVRAAALARVSGAVDKGMLGRRVDGARELAAACEVLRQPPDRDTVWAVSHLARAQLFIGAELDGADLISQEALQLAQDLGVDHDLMTFVCASRALVLENTNRYEEAVALLEHAARLASLSDRGQTVRFRANTLVNLSSMLLTVDAERARDTAGQSLDLGRRLGIHTAVTGGLCNEVAAELWLGRWDSAGRLLDGAEQDNVADDPAVQQTASMLAALRGDVAVLGSMTGLPGLDSEDMQDAAYAGVIECMTAAARGDHARAIDVARTTLPIVAGSFGLRNECYAWAWTLGHRAAHEGGDEQARSQFIALLDARPDGWVPKLLLAERSLSRALAERSVPAAQEAIGTLRAVGSPFHLAHALLDLAELQDDDPDAARACLDEATTIQEALGAATLRNRLLRLPLPSGSQAGAR